MKIASQARPAHAVGDRPGWGPTPRSHRSYTARPEGRAMRALRATAYVLTSLASLVFLLLVGYGAARLTQLHPLLPVLP
jgi:hypothetical protein